MGIKRQGDERKEKKIENKNFSKVQKEHLNVLQNKQLGYTLLGKTSNKKETHLKQLEKPIH